jgi:hypothetical protein
MKKINFYISFIICFIVFSACKSTKSSTSSNKKSNRATISGNWRPKFVPEAVVHQNTDNSNVSSNNTINERLNEILDSVAVYNATVSKAAGYRIVVYSGINREDANKTKEKLYKSFPDLDIYTTYKQPSFKVKVGDYFTRLEAQKMYNQLRTKFQNVLVIDDEILIHR